MSGGSYQGTGAATILDPKTVQVGATPVGGSTGTQTVLAAGGASGIVAESGGLPWAGVDGFVLSVPD